MKNKYEYTKEQLKAKNFTRLLFVQGILLLLFLFFCIKILLTNFSWRVFFCFLFLMCVCGVYGWAAMQRKKNNNLFECVVGFGFFVWFCIISLILTV
jgi:hypothetical protein